MKILVLIPAYNEESKISEVVKDIKALGLDVLVIDDGSVDETVKQAKISGALVLKHKLNRGQGAALRTGIEYAKRKKYEVAVFFDADGQMKAQEIKDILQPILANEFEVVLGSRFLGQAKNIPLTKLITLKLARLFTRLTTGLKLTDRLVINQLSKVPFPFAISSLAFDTLFRNLGS